MKILELKFKNLNSLYGEWLIDFTSPEYVSNGIFALTGPTGAGKSTILDAICLALYGATPRLGKITKSGNEIMSRQTGECYAEVVFKAQAGRFRCHWSQHRARKKADGKLADSKHEISDAESGQILESKKREVARVIEEKTGMDFERFTRSILLAQGGFDTFLKADVEQKSKILEQITGTEIYSEISKRVHERQRSEREKLNLLTAETSGITILEPEQKEEIQRELVEKQKQEAGLTTKVAEVRKAITWLIGIDGLKKEISSSSKELEDLSIELKTFNSERVRLDCALKAAELDGCYATLVSHRKQQQEERKALLEKKSQLPEAKAAAKKSEKEFWKSEQSVVKAKEIQRTAIPILQKTRTLDQQLIDKKKLIDTGADDCDAVTKKIAADSKLLKKERARLKTVQSKLKLIQDYLESNTQDELLVSGLAGIEEQLNNLLLVQEDLLEKKAALVRSEDQLKSTSENLILYATKLSSCKQKLKKAQEKRSEKENDLTTLLGERLLREYRTQKETLLREMAFSQTITALEDERTRLEDGKPCPLCGANAHPFAEGNVPGTDETEKKIDALGKLIKKAEATEASINKLAVAEKEVLSELTDAEKVNIDVTNNKKNAEKSLNDARVDFQKCDEHFAKLSKLTLAKLQPLGVKEIPDSNVGSLLESLRKRLNDWKVKRSEQGNLEKQISELDGKLIKRDAVVETQAKALQQKQASQKLLLEEFEKTNAERRELFGNKKTDAEDTRLEKTVLDAELIEKSTRILRDEAKQSLDSAKLSITSLKERIDKRVSELQVLEADFVIALQRTGFADEKQFSANSLPSQERDKLRIMARDLDNRNTELQAQKKDRESRFGKEIAKKITELPLSDLELAYKELDENLKSLRDITSGLKHKLTDDLSAKKLLAGKHALIESQRKECNRWDKLHGLIGSADGKKYRNFAQGLTFQVMVSHANQQLRKMTDRYLLILDEDHPLELNVIDDYQAGEIRSTKNLSGGESFIVSLTLALGLSKMASRKVKVDSLFLDEGFGTLDQEALEVSLETLAGLQQDGKIIGVISHVLALKERISTQISVEPVSGGKSIIAGPGCRKITMPLKKQ